MWRAPRAASLMSLTTSSGCDTMGTWLEAISKVVAPIRWANKRSALGGIASSFLATRYHDGSVFQAGVPITSPSAVTDNGCCTAYMTLA